MSQDANSAAPAPVGHFGYCLNTSTIRGHALGIVGEAEVAAKAGYGAIEPWIESIQDYQKSGGSLDDLKKRIADLGLKVPGAIGFAHWIVDDPAERQRGLEQARRDMDLVRRIGGTGIAAPPVGATEQDDLDLHAAAERYRTLLELGEEMGVVPMVEVWGFSRTLGRLSEAVMVAVASGHPAACVLADVFHLYKGGSGFAGLKLLGPNTLPVFHVNDYPAEPPREEIGDAQRVYPGDGVAPLGAIFSDLAAAGFRGWLSLELFNRDYWKDPAPQVAATGLAKMQAAVQQALAGG